KDILIKALSDRNWMVREGAVRIIGDLRLKQAVAEVKELLSDEIMWVRASAVWALGELGSRSSEQAIISALDDESDFVIRWAQSALKSLHRVGDKDKEWFHIFWESRVLGNYEASDMEDYYVKGLQNVDWWVRQVSIEAVMQMESQKAKRYLLKLSTDENEWIRTWVMRALGEIKYPESEDILIQSLRDDSIWVRVWVAESLRKFRSTRAEDALLDALHTSNEKNVRLAIISALAECGTSKSIRTLKEVQNWQDPELLAEATAASDLIIEREKKPEQFSVLRVIERTSTKGMIISSQQFKAALDGLDTRLVANLKPEIKNLRETMSVHINALNELKASLPSGNEFSKFMSTYKDDIQGILVKHLEDSRKLTLEEKENALSVINDFVGVEDSTKLVLRLPLLIGYLEKSYNIKLDIGKSITTILAFLIGKMRR
ncbi:MAG TPA: HEAT repeat domain-containing protein, partial [Candidatus Hodarchaeales archaeon]|nr:HEAT repeat domain-containing protein [Candidatus Hodarchaeales archaeon]